MFWSSVNLTGNQTAFRRRRRSIVFWSSVNLTGNQTKLGQEEIDALFWSSVNLTGNQTVSFRFPAWLSFWSSVNLTGNQTMIRVALAKRGFGAVSIQMLVKSLSFTVEVVAPFWSGIFKKGGDLPEIGWFSSSWEEFERGGESRPQSETC